MKRELYWSDRVKRYYHTYKALGLGWIFTVNNEKIRDGFLYQEPNPDYDMWYPKNCTPIFFKDWIQDKIPEGMAKPKPGKRSQAYFIKPRPLICIETGKYYPSVLEAKKDGYTHASDVAKGWTSQLFDHECRFTYVDPFLPWSDEPWVGHINKVHNPNSSGNCRVKTVIDGKDFNDLQQSAVYLAEQTGSAYNYIYKNLKRRVSEFKGHSIKYSR